MKQLTCYCEEAFRRPEQGKKSDKERLGPVKYGEYHDCAYIMARSSVVPKAEELAIRDCETEEGEIDSVAFNKSFARHMEALYNAI